MKKNFYVLSFEEDATAPNCDSNKPYFGTMDDLCSYIDMHRKEELKPGQIKVVDITCCNKGVSQTLSDKYWIYRTIDGMYYDLHADKVEVTQVAVKYDGYYHRCMRARFTNLSVETHYSSQEHHLIDVIMGQPYAFITDFEDENNRIIQSRFFVSEDSYNTLKEARERMAEQYLSFDSLMEDIFGEN